MEIDYALYVSLLEQEVHRLRSLPTKFEKDMGVGRAGASQIDVDASKISPEHFEMVERAIIKPVNRTLDFLNRER